MGQTWERLLFAHWPVAPEQLEKVVPPELPLDVVDGQAWIAVTPFRVNAFRLRFTYPLPLISGFPEINVRTYVTVGGRPGIYFFSLDTSNRLAVEAARRVFRLPYFHARQHMDRTAFETERTQGDGPPAAFRASYHPVGEPFQPRPGSIEHFLTERYCLYTLDEEGRIYRGEIHHRPWQLQSATADIELNEMTAQIGVELEGTPLLHYAERQDVVFWQLSGVA